MIKNESPYCESQMLMFCKIVIWHLCLKRVRKHYSHTTHLCRVGKKTMKNEFSFIHDSFNVTQIKWK